VPSTELFIYKRFRGVLLAGAVLFTRLLLQCILYSIDGHDLSGVPTVELRVLVKKVTCRKCCVRCCALVVVAAVLQLWCLLLVVLVFARPLCVGGVDGCGVGGRGCTPSLSATLD
jgi:hypothetical protein